MQLGKGVFQYDFGRRHELENIFQTEERKNVPLALGWQERRFQIRRDTVTMMDWRERCHNELTVIDGMEEMVD